MPGRPAPGADVRAALPGNVPQTTAGWIGRSRPSPTVIPLGKGEYSLREALRSSLRRQPPRLAGRAVQATHAAVGAVEQTLDAPSERSHRNDGNDGDQAHEQCV